jgi:membrane dipeptidase
VIAYHATMQWVDGHLDLAYLAVGGRDMTRADVDPATGCVSLPELRRAGVDIVIGTIFTERAIGGPSRPHTYPTCDDLAAAEEAGLRQLRVYEQLERQGELAIVRSHADLDRDGPRPRIVLLMEGADPIRSPEHARRWFDQGVRIVGLAWTAGTRYAGGNGAGGPLTPLGVELVAALDECGIIHDVSHLSDEAFDGLLARAKGRIIASHSNCRALLDNKQRHLRDDQIKSIAQRGGVIGLNLYCPFLCKATQQRANVQHCMAHVQHVAGIMGHKTGVGLGSDMDGGFPPSDLPAELDRPTKLVNLARALREHGWTVQEILGFAFGNWTRFLRSALASPRSSEGTIATNVLG